LALLLLAATLSWAATLKVAQPDQRLYPDPDLTSPVLATLPQGAEVLVLRQLGAWYKVDYQGKKGWAEQVTFRFPDLLSPEPVKDGKGEDAVIGGMAKRKSPETGMMASKQPPSAGIMAERAEPAPPPAGGMTPKPAAAPGKMAAKAPPPTGMKAEKTPPTPEKPASLAPKFLRVQEANQFLYPDPDTSSSPLGPVPVKARVKMLKQEGDWYKVEHQGKPGWLPIQAMGR
jgi:uncharacterized protein YgiM (DUF1202 family)